MRRIGSQRWTRSAILNLVALAATCCGRAAIASATSTRPCTASMIHAALLPPGRYTATYATNVYLYETEAVELTNTSAGGCYLSQPTLMDVSVPSGLLSVADLYLAPSHVNVPSATSATLKFGALVGCATFQAPIWASSVTVTFPHVGNLRLGGLHMGLPCGAPQLLSFQ